MLGYLVAGSVTVVLLWVLPPLAIRIGLVDSPGGRRAHFRSTPLIGGIAMFCGFLFGVLALDTALAEWRSFFAASALLVIIGILDDFHELSARARFTAQVGAALIMTLWGGVVVEDLGNLLGTGNVALGIWAVPFTVFGTLGVINALNMVDGVDGLAGSLALLVFATLAWVAHVYGLDGDSKILVVLAAAVAAFLSQNIRLPKRPQALVFMGDAGSMFLGLAIAWFVVRLSQAPVPVIEPAVALWLFALPLMDAVASLLRRLVRRRSPFSGDREHAHHLLLRVGYSAAEALLILLALAIALLGIGLAGLFWEIPEPVLFYGFLGAFGLYLLLLERTARFARP